MRADVFVDEVLVKCDVLKKSNLWLGEPRMRPRAWIGNFDESDRYLAAFLLDKFTFYNAHLTEMLLKASYNSLGDGLPKNTLNSDRSNLLEKLPSAVFVPVMGELPNPTDSGFLFCRKARQVLAIPESRFCTIEQAIDFASQGKTIVFLDDFIGSGDQFITTWKKKDVQKKQSFESIHLLNKFDAIYITLVSTLSGIQNISFQAPNVSISSSHVINDTSSIFGLFQDDEELKIKIQELLMKYSNRLEPRDAYMKQSTYLAYGYKNKGLLFGFEHSIPDSTLPIFWASGSKWKPLIERQ